MNINKPDWQTAKLKDLCEKVECIQNHKKTGNFNYIDIGSINSNLNTIDKIQNIDWNNASSRARQIIKKNDILFSTVRVNLKRVAFVEENIPNGIASTGFTILRAKKYLLDPLFLFYISISPMFLNRLIQKQVGTAYPAVTDKMVLNQDVPLPPLEEQQRIVDLLQSIDNNINLAERQVSNFRWLLQELINDYLRENSRYRKGNLKEIIFSEIAQNISEHIEPQNFDNNYFVGLDHLDPQDIHINRYGKTDGLIGTKLKGYKKDIIFSKRNAYLRKAAVLEFDCVCSAHSMIIRAKKENIFEDFLPYFMHSDSFMLRAKEISEGSISPTIKWKNLAKQKFYIPIMEDQESLTNIFRQIDKTIIETKLLISVLKNLQQKLIYEILG